MRVVIKTLFWSAALLAVLAALFSAHAFTTVMSRAPSEEAFSYVTGVVALAWSPALGLSVVAGLLSFSMRSLGGDK